MSSSTLDTITDYLSHIQQRRIFTRERFSSIRVYLFRSIGLFICLFQSYRILKYFFWFIFHMLSIILWIPLKTIELFIPKIPNYNIIIPLLWFCSVISFSIAKYSHRNIRKRHSFILIFILLLLLQSLFIILPIARSVHPKVESDVEDEQNIAENVTNLQISPTEKQELLILVDSPRRFSSKLLENLSHFFRNKIEQIKETEQRISSKEYLSHNSFSSIYTAFTDLSCYDYTKLVYHHKQKYIDFLHTYRHRSPFPIYLSILKSNGPTCDLYFSSSSCAIRSKFKSKLFRFIRFWLIIGLPIIICVVIYNRLRFRQRVDACNQSSNEGKLPKYSNLQPLDKNIENKLRLWLEQEESHGYQNINESCCMAFNRTYSQQYVSNSNRLFEKL